MYSNRSEMTGAAEGSPLFISLKDMLNRAQTSRLSHVCVAVSSLHFQDRGVKKLFSFSAFIFLFTFAITLPNCGGHQHVTANPIAVNQSIKASANGRYLVDQNGSPTLLLVDGSLLTGITQLGESDWRTYLSNRQTHGFNAVWALSLCHLPESPCNDQLATHDSIKPFTSGTNYANYDLSAPNSAYWSRIDSYINIAASYGIIIVLDAWDTAGGSNLWTLATANGDTKMNAFGRFLGSRYKTFPNVIWIVGNDFQDWTTGLVDGTANGELAAAHNALIKNLTAGIAATDGNHLITTELNYNISGSQDDSVLTPYTTLSGTYTYYPNYAMATKEYNAAVIPVFLFESYWEGGHYGNLTPTVATNKMMRAQAYWTVLAGGLGGVTYGNNDLIHLNTGWITGWQHQLDTTAVGHMTIFKTFMTSYPWYKLVPDQANAVVTAGYGRATGQPTGGGYGSGREDTDNYVTTARAADGSLIMSYLPVNATITVDMTKMRGPASARWFDPTNAKYTAIAGSPFPNTEKKTFSAPGNNSAGDPDWVLVLENH